MPEIKNSFVQGKMNKDLDERLIPNGQYRDAMNVEVSTSEGSNVGVVQNILGNHRIESIVGEGFTCVGSIANEKTNKLYWFISKYNKDVIIEYDVENSTPENPILKPVLVDLYAGTYKAVLKFVGNIITGINIIDNLLFWTDNNGEPKKINIDDCKAGTANIDTHTQLIFDNGSFNGITLDLVTPWSGSDTDHISDFQTSSESNLIGIEKTGRNVWFKAKQMQAILGIDEYNTYDEVTDLYTGIDAASYISGSPRGHRAEIKHYRDGKFLGVKRVRVGRNARCRLVIDPYQYNTSVGYPLDVGDLIVPNPYYVSGGPNDVDAQKQWQVGDVLFGNNVKIDIEERHITVIRPKPLNVLSVKINHTESVNATSNIPNLFETKFPRFSYRYKYRDGEYSAFAPFTAPVFNPKYPKDKSSSVDTNIFYNKDNAYDINEPYNKAMVNSIHSVILSGFITAETPENVIEVDVLYKQEESNVIYSIDTIKHIDADWHISNPHEGYGLNIGLGKETGGATAQGGLATSSYGGSNSYKAEGSLTKGRHTVTTENIYAALPADQLLRPWDNVPKKALSQEITGNRIVYGNYVQNYDLIEDAQVSISYSDRKANIQSFESQGLPSVKSQRNYQVGVVYCDKYGRETPVFTSKTGAVNIPWQDFSGNKNASRSLQLNASATANFPEWVDSLKFFIKESSNPYYNLVMERAWVTKSTYELDNSEGHLWISFPSSDRNKLSEEDYIILKKKIGTGEEQVNFENKYKVIDIKNEAPDAIKFELIDYGTKFNGGEFGTSSPNLLAIATPTPANCLFYLPNKRIDKEVNDIIISEDVWKGVGGGTAFENLGSEILENPSATETTSLIKDLYISWRRIGVDNSASKKYKVVSGSGGGGGDSFRFKLQRKITKIDADIAHVNSDSSDLTQDNLHPDIVFQIEKKEPKDLENFSGKFFVKISKNHVTDIVETGNPVDITKQYQVTSKTSAWAWKDDTGSSASVESGSYGITNYSGFSVSYAAADYIQTAVNNDVGDATGGANGGDLRVTDYALPWAGIQAKLNLNGYGKGAWFIDMMHMSAGQSNAGNYAKYCCITWAGCTKNEDGSSGTALTQGAGNEESAWSYPPLKTWITDFEDTSNLITPPSPSSNAILAGAGVVIPAQSIWYENNLISTSVVLEENDNYFGLKIDGWVGPLQNVNRNFYQPIIPNPGYDYAKNHINGLEGFVTTTTKHAEGPRRWLSGMNGSDTGVGVNTKTYSANGEVGKHFMHLSFFAPGKDLHDADFGFGAVGSGNFLYGDNAYMAKLQGIWGGGVFTGKTQGQTFGAGHQHLAMEGNYDDGDNVIMEAPGPNIGYGYDTDYRELHERQWDPTFTVNEDFDNKTRDFLRNLHAGSKFRFNKINDGAVPTTDNTVYTIKSVSIKKLYNHTSWRTAYNRFISNPSSGDPGYLNVENENFAYKSVEEVGLKWLDQVGADGYGTNLDDIADDFRQKIVDFGSSHNRRLCYIIELDKNPVNSTSVINNPLASGIMTADFLNGDFCDIEFLDPVKDIFLSDLSKFPAIWEVDPKKQQVDLDIYYEASNNIPVKINDKTNELFAPIGCKVEILNSSVGIFSAISENVEPVYLEAWDGIEASFFPGFPKDDGVGNEINYAEMSFKFIREDGSYTIAEAGGQVLDGLVTGIGAVPLVKTTFNFRQDVADVIASGMDWYNCFSFGNGVESNRIRDDFNEPFISNGVKASTTTQEPYRQERRKSGLIYSGIYNSNSGINNLNQFIMADKITKDLNPTYGSIQKLFQRRISLIAFCEDRVISIVSNKDTLFNADGNSQLVASNKVLGDANPFSGDFGISKNPESFASESYRAYFTDKQRGVVMRLSKDGLTPISNAGMKDWFRDNLPDYNSLIGTYDSYKEDYNITLTNNPNFYENLVIDAYFDTGGEGYEGDGLGQEGVFNTIKNNGPTGTELLYLWENPFHPVLEWQNNSNAFNWSPFTNDMYDFKGSAVITHHAAIPYGSLQGYVEAVAGGGTSTSISLGAYAQANNLTDNGWWYDPRFNSPGTSSTSNSDIFGGNAGSDLDQQVSSTIVRAVEQPDGVVSIINEGSVGSHVMYQYKPGYSAYGSWAVGSYYPWTHKYNGSPHQNANPQVEKLIGGGLGDAFAYDGDTGSGSTQGSNIDRISSTISRNKLSHAIVFDRARNGSYVEFKDIGNSGNNLLDSYNANTSLSESHDSFFNGEEIHIQFEITAFDTVQNGSNQSGNGYNYIVPQIQIFDGGSPVPSTKLQVTSVVASVSGDDYYGEWQTLPGDANFSGTPMEPTNTTATYETISGQSYPNPSYQFIYDPTSHLSSQGSPTVAFLNTDNISELTAVSQGYASGLSRKIMIGCSFKFIDSVQQNTDGTPNFTITYDPITGDATNGITPVKVINNLSIRIKNTKGTYPGSHASYNQSYPGITDPYGVGLDPRWGPSYTTDYPFTRQLWEVNALYVKKGLGITGGSIPTGGTIPDTAEVEAVPPYDVPAWTQVAHAAQFGFDGNNDWKFKIDSGVNLYGNQSHQQSISVFGNDFAPVSQTGKKQNLSDPASAPSEDIHYSVPQTWGFNSSTSQDQDGNAFTYTSLSSATVNAWNGASGIPVNGSPWGYADIGYGSNSGISTSSTTNLGYPGFNFNRVNSSNNTYTGDTEIWLNDYVDIKTTGGVPMYNNQVMFHDISNDPWKVGRWYLIDIEFDSTNPIVADGNVVLGGSNNNRGTVYVAGVSGGVGVSSIGSDVDPVNGVGLYGGDITYPSGITKQHLLALQKVTRTKYGNSETVLRGIFKIPVNSDCVSTQAKKDKIEIIFHNFQVFKIEVKKIICKRLNGNGIWDNWLGTNGLAANWISNAGIPEIANPVHAFDDKYMYYYNSSLNWEIPSNTASLDLFDWKQFFVPPPWVGPTQWELSFTFTKNTYTNNQLGGLRGFAATSNPNALFLAGASDGHEGVYFDGIEDEGRYKILFNFDGSVSLADWTFEKAELATPNTFTTFTTGNLIPTSNVFTGATSAATTADRILFYPENTSDAQEYAIKDIVLTDNVPIFIGGGTGGGWSFNGFDSSLYNYIYWDFENQNLQFLACPFAVLDGPELEFISVSQPIEATINRYEKYRIRFTHGITENSTATLAIYYYNTLGFGFKIQSINHLTPGFSGVDPVTGLVVDTGSVFEQIVTIGDPASETNHIIYYDNSVPQNVKYILGKSLWSSTSEEDINFNPNFKNRFVIQVQPASEIDPVTGLVWQTDTNATIFGYIDNLEMVKVIDGLDLPDNTVSFSEGVNGWTSFKSFIPENGISVSKKYFTFDQGMLYQHYVPLKDGAIGFYGGSPGYLFNEYALSDANNYNQFYSNLEGHSTITAVLNQEPSVVKMFNTINYEGTQAYIVEPTKADEITLNNVAAWNAGNDILGWECTSIITDLDYGTVNEFILKEGKWFNYIKGLNHGQPQDTSLFSVQGVDIMGEVIEVGGDPFTDARVINNVTSLVVPNVSTVSTGEIVSPIRPSSGVVRGGGTGGGGY